MTYSALSLVLIGIGAVVAIIGLMVRKDRSRILRRFGVPWLVTLLTLLFLTGVFDNLMIGAGLFGYSAGQRSGLQVGLAPVEDFSYPAAVALLVPGLLLFFRCDAGRYDAAGRDAARQGGQRAGRGRRGTAWQEERGLGDADERH